MLDFRDRFVVDDPNLLYLDGNSLGRMPKAAAERVRQVTEEQWGSRLVRGWGEGWLDLPRRVGDKIGQMIGAEPGEVLVADSTSVNLYKLFFAALSARPERRRIVTDAANFPSDQYLLQGLRLSFPDLEILRVGQETEVTSLEDLRAALEDSVALLTLSHVGFRTSQLFDIAAVTAMAHEVGAWVLWDLSHSAGILPVELGAANADLAVGCGYKYLNGGPGAPAYLYVRRDLQEQLVSPIWGWFGQHRPFDFALDYTPATGIDRFMAGTPPILSLAALEPGVDLILEAGIDAIRAKSVQITSRLIHLADRELAPFGFDVASPRDPGLRGGHVTLTHPAAWPITQALVKEANLIPDFRPPNGLRLGFSPLYNTLEEVDEAVRRIREVVKSRAHEKYPTHRASVT